jgi:hypothetical protein
MSKTIQVREWPNTQRRYVLLSKQDVVTGEDLTAVCVAFVLDDGTRLLATFDPRQEEPAVVKHEDPQLARDHFEGKLKESVANGWQIGYDGTAHDHAPGLN